MSSRSSTVAQIEGNISAAARSRSGNRPSASALRTSLWRKTATRPVPAGNPPANPRGGIRSQWLWAIPRTWPVDHNTVASVIPIPPRMAPGPPESVTNRRYSTSIGACASNTSTSGMRVPCIVWAP